MIPNTQIYKVTNCTQFSLVRVNVFFHFLYELKIFSTSTGCVFMTEIRSLSLHFDL